MKNPSPEPRRIMRTRLRPLALLALALLTACSGASGITGSGPEGRDLYAARRRWAREGSASYSLTVRPLCFCGDTREMRVTVSRGVITSRVYVEDGSAVPAGRFPELGRVDDLFAAVADALAQHAYDVNATYDAHGVPVTVGIDYERNTADEEFGWTVTDYLPAS
jgi:hypothetical protein